MDRFQVYKDIEARTNGEIYIGVVGPVRTGKSTFIKRFMDVLVLPEMEDEHARMRTQDELPQSASGRTIMTTEPKFVPKEAAKIRLADDVDVKVRLIDCVGYMVEGAAGYMDGDSQRQVKTPWFAYEIPFAKAAGIGTRKVIHDHSTIGIVITTDGTITDIPRENYKDAERMTIQELNGIGKPFIVLVNSKEPQGERAQNTAKNLEQEYGVRDAFTTVRMKGYGVVSPVRDEITLLEPELIKQGNKYGVKIHSKAPSIHLIRANIETEIAPIVGTEDQAKDLLTFIKQEAETEHGIWETNIFGKSVEELVMDGIRGKIAMIGDESQTKLQDTMQKIVNDSNGGLVCIII